MRETGRARATTLLALAAVAVIAVVTTLAGAAPWSASSRGPAKPSAAAVRATARPVQVPCAARGFGSFTAGHWPPACWHPYGPTSPFNTAIPANPRLEGDSASIVREMVAHNWSFAHGRSSAFVLDPGGSRPVYWARASDPLVRVVCRQGGYCQPGLRLHIPPGARPQHASDGHMAVIDQATGREYDFWRAQAPSNGQIVASAASSIPIGAASGTGVGGEGEAAHLGLLGGLIRAPELAAGKIEHALATTAQCVSYRDVWPSPARAHGDEVCGGPAPHFGSLLQLNMSSAEIAATHAPAWELAIMRAMARYGVYVVDTNGGPYTEMSLLKEDDLSYTSFGYPGQLSAFVQRAAGSRSFGGHGSLVGVPIDVSKLRVIAPCVPRRTC